jgi:hypothetical protein
MATIWHWYTQWTGFFVQRSMALKFSNIAKIIADHMETGQTGQP